MSIAQLEEQIEAGNLEAVKEITLEEAFRGSVAKIPVETFISCIV